MDTYKEKQTLDELYHRGNAPWVVWNKDDLTSTPARRLRPHANGRFANDIALTESTRESAGLVAAATAAS
jgi:hypothetical protein